MNGVVKERFVEMRKAAGLSQSALARRVGVGQSSINRIERDDTHFPRKLTQIAKELGTTPEYLTGESDDPSLASQGMSVPRRSDEDALADRNLVPVKEVDLSYGMGGTFLDVPAAEDVRYFPRNWLRQFTDADPADIFFAQGIGDSMFPTIGNGDTLLIDASQNSVTMGDKVWAIAIGEVGSVKRLRPLGEKLHILSDNTNVSPAIATIDEVTIIGRIVAIVRKI